MTPFELLLYALATFRLAYMITKESGPMFVFLKLRKAVKKDKGSSAAEGISCPYCVSVWCASMFFAFHISYRHLPEKVGAIGIFVVMVLALGGAAMLIHQLFIFLRRE